MKLWTGFTKEGSSLERTKVVKVSTLTFTSVHVEIEVQRKIYIRERLMHEARFI